MWNRVEWRGVAPVTYCAAQVSTIACGKGGTVEVMGYNTVCAYASTGTGRSGDNGMSLVESGGSGMLHMSVAGGKHM